MKFLLVFVSIILTIIAANDENLWVAFKRNHSKTYKSLMEEKRRFSIFQSNLRIIEEHNLKYENGEETYYMGINQFTDLTDEEFQSIYLSEIPESPIEHDKVFKLPSGVDIPDAIDWRDKGVVTPVKDQGLCGCCWAFSATGAVEGQYAIKHGNLVILSEQDLVECLSKSCYGGTQYYAFQYMIKNGIATNESYPYTSVDGHYGQCKKGKDSGVKVVDYVIIPSGEEALKQAVGIDGPIAVSVNASTFSKYAGGIFNYPDCGKSHNHAVLAVGYGTKNGLDYWIVKNSWGITWGEKGYINMARNKNNQCNIGLTQYRPILCSDIHFNVSCIL